jgi:hypothetical protein
MIVNIHGLLMVIIHVVNDHYVMAYYTRCYPGLTFSTHPWPRRPWPRSALSSDPRVGRWPDRPSSCGDPGPNCLAANRLGSIGKLDDVKFL